MKKRVRWLDIARCIAIVSITCNHALNRSFRSVGSSYESYVSLPHIDIVLRAILDVFSRIGAPLFLMISGALLLEKKFDDSGDVIKFYKKNLLSIFVTSEIWYFIMFWYRTLLGANDILKTGGWGYALLRCIGTMLFINQETMGNMWYIPMILCLYTIIPMICIYLKKINNKLFLLPIIIVVFSSMIIPNINQLFDIKGKGIEIDFNLDSKNVFSLFLLYILFGFFIKKRCLEKIPSVLICIFAFFAFVICCSFQYWEYTIPGDNDIKYDFFILAVCSVLFFEMIRRFSGDNSKGSISCYISKISFGIFFVHIFIVSLVSGILKFEGVNRIVVFLIYEVISLSGSVVIIFVLSRIPIIKKYVFLIKD